MLTLQLIRHAKTLQSSSSGRDADRELMDKGIAQANLLGHYIEAHHIEMGKILCSAATRTRQTHSIISRQTAEPCETEFRQSLYLASMDQLLQELKHEKAKKITLIGHNEGISELASFCSDEHLDMRTAELITLSFPFESWDFLSRGTGIISLRYRPEVFLP